MPTFLSFPTLSTQRVSYMLKRREVQHADESLCSITVSVLSIGMSCVYAGSRTLLALAEQGYAPKFFVSRSEADLFHGFAEMLLSSS
jgi:L-asparagine transporter-like permease